MYLHGVCIVRNSKTIAGKGRQENTQMSIGSSSRLSAFLAYSKISQLHSTSLYLRHSTFHLSIHHISPSTLCGVDLLGPHSPTSFICCRLSFRTVFSSSKSLLSDAPHVRHRQVSILSIHLPASLLPDNSLVFADGLHWIDRMIDDSDAIFFEFCSSAEDSSANLDDYDFNPSLEGVEAEMRA
jgi:hypothetical protein